MRYTLRAVKYFVKLLILLAVIFCLMSLSGTTVFSAENFMAEFFSTTRGRIFSAAVVIWCALYPKVEYISRFIPDVDVQRNRPQIISAFEAAGMRLESRTDRQLVFRAGTVLRRTVQMWEDAVEVTAAEGGIVIEGNRRAIAATEFRIKLYTENDNA